jgi:YHS domain-containing protein
VKARRNFIRDLVTHSASDVTHIGLSSNCVLHNISEYLNFCPISYKIRREYVKVCIKNYQNIALFNRKIYAFKSEKELKDFINNPDTFVNRGSAFAPPEEINVEDIYNLHHKFEDKGYCMIELSKKNLTRGNSLFGLAYKDKYFLTSTAKNQRLFQRNPALYEMVKLPDKLPVEF